MQPEHIRRGLLEAAMDAPDDLVAVVSYMSISGELTRRTVSPIRYLTPDRVRVYCLGRGGPRSLYVNRILDVRIKIASDVLAPEAVRSYQDGRREVQ